MGMSAVDISAYFYICGDMRSLIINTNILAFDKFL